MKSKRTCNGVSVVAGIAASLFYLGAAIAQTVPERNAAVYMYKGADRDQRLLERARKEGTLTFYTSLATTESIPLTQAFEKKTGVKVQLWRSLSEEVIQRTLNEARARRHVVDVVETNGPEVEVLAREQITAEFFTPHTAKYPPWALPSHRLWVSDRMDFFVVAYNTNKVKREELPATYEGFVEPKWKGRLGIEATDQEWLAGVVKQWGSERGLGFFRKLVAMRPDVRKGHVLLAQLIAAGEIHVGLTAYASNAESSKRTGAPIDWVALEPVVVRPQGLAVSRNAPNPNAALLFADYLLSPEGQQFYESVGRFPASRGVRGAGDPSKVVMVDSQAAADEADKWQKIWSELLKR
ncbi:MAG: extracellular solute-binding protein [Betaproteobacteria bacterium]|nr:extracellular solute-binding protein [Betaproteobacteria bacterium]